MDLQQMFGQQQQQSQPRPVPNNVQAAFGVLNWVANMRLGMAANGMPPVEMTALELQTYNAALTTVKLYTSGEHTFSDFTQPPGTQ